MSIDDDCLSLDANFSQKIFYSNIYSLDASAPVVVVSSELCVRFTAVMHWSIFNTVVVFILVIGVSELGSRYRTAFLVSAVNPNPVDNSHQTPQKSSVTASLPQDSGNVSTSGNDTNLITTSNYVGKVKFFLEEHRGVIYRSIIVLASVTGIVLVYLFIRWIG